MQQQQQLDMLNVESVAEYGRQDWEKLLAPSSLKTFIDAFERSITQPDLLRAMNSRRYWYMCAIRTLMQNPNLDSNRDIINNLVMVVKRHFGHLTCYNFLKLGSAGGDIINKDSNTSTRISLNPKLLDIFNQIPRDLEITNVILATPSQQQQPPQITTEHEDAIAHLIKSYNIGQPLSTTTKTAAVSSQKIIPRHGVPVRFYEARYTLAYLLDTPVRNIWYPNNGYQSLYPNLRSVLYNVVQRTGINMVVRMSSPESNSTCPNKIYCAVTAINAALSTGRLSSIGRDQLDPLNDYVSALTTIQRASSGGDGEKQQHYQAILKRLLNVFKLPIQLAQINASEKIIFMITSEIVKRPLNVYEDKCKVKINNTNNNNNKNKSITTSQMNGGGGGSGGSNDSFVCPRNNTPTLSDVLLCAKFSPIKLFMTLKWVLDSIDEQVAAAADKSSPPLNEVKLDVTRIDLCPVQVKHIVTTFQYFNGYCNVPQERGILLVRSGRHLPPQILDKLNVSSADPLLFDWLAAIKVEGREMAHFKKLLANISFTWPYDFFKTIVQQCALNNESCILMAAYYGINVDGFWSMLLSQQLFELHNGDNSVGVQAKYELFSRLTTEQQKYLNSRVTSRRNGGDRTTTTTDQSRVMWNDGVIELNRDKPTGHRLLDLLCNIQSLWDEDLVTTALSSIYDLTCNRISSAHVIEIVRELMTIRNNVQLQYKVAAQFNLSEFAIMKYWQEISAAATPGGSIDTALQRVVQMLLLSSTASRNLKRIVYESLDITPMPLFSDTYLVDLAMEDFYRANYRLDTQLSMQRRNKDALPELQRKRQLKQLVSKPANNKKSLYNLVMLDYVKATNDVNTLGILKQ